MVAESVERRLEKVTVLSANFTEDTIKTIRTTPVFASFRQIVSRFGGFFTLQDK